MQKTSEIGLEHIKSFESFQPVAYECSAGKPTIGYGHTRTVRDVDVGNLRITEAQALDLLAVDIAVFEKCVRDNVRVPLKQHQFDALVGLAYNIGCPQFSTSSVVRYLNEGRFQKAATRFALWNKVTNPVTRKKRVEPGLVRRREAERKMFLGLDR